MKQIIIIIILLLLSCSSYVFETGKSLAEFQDQKFEDYKGGKSLTEEEKNRLEKNMWVITARELAIGNLPVRQYCLIDLYNNSNNNKDIIKVMLDTLGNQIWREGYTYWLYTKPFLMEYYKKFGLFGSFVDEMDAKFKRISYEGFENIYFPAPYGDVRKTQLEKFLQNDSIIVKANDIIFPVSKNTILPGIIEYTVEGCPIGFNTHVPNERQIIKVIGKSKVCVYTNDSCSDFSWYEGYDKKYDGKLSEYMDTFNYDRVNSLNAAKWWMGLTELLKELKYIE